MAQNIITDIWFLYIVTEIIVGTHFSLKLSRRSYAYVHNFELHKTWLLFLCGLSRDGAHRTVVDYRFKRKNTTLITCNVLASP